MNNLYKKRLPAGRQGFTLIELMVSVAIFSTVMLIALGALLSISESDRRAESLKSVINNLNFAVDSLSRAARTGSAYACNPTLPISGPATPADCTTPPGATSLAFVDTTGRTVVYRLENAALARSIDGGVTFSPVTSPEVTITSLSFYVVGSSPSDQAQPKLSILLSGFVQVTPTLTSQFNLQTSVTQRLYDQ